MTKKKRLKRIKELKQNWHKLQLGLKRKEGNLSAIKVINMWIKHIDFALTHHMSKVEQVHK